MVESKSDQLSVQHKDQGNRYYKEKELFKAICEYNKALLYAQSKENLALAYANRSAVFLELHKYDECLQNIQWARENNYPADKIQKLNEREEKCQKLKAEQAEDPLDDIRDFFKLSYPPNPKIPFIADCLRLGSNPINGRRGIFTTRDLKPGDIVAIEKSIIINVHEKYSHLRCCNCAKGKMLNLLPCTKSASLMFCSVKCRDDTYSKNKSLDFMVAFNSFADTYPRRMLREAEEAFGGRNKLMKFLKGNWQNLSCTVFDFDFSNPDDPSYRANLFKCFLAQGLHFRPLIKQAAGSNKLIEKFLDRLSTLFATHSLYGNVTNECAMDGSNEMEVITINAFNTHFNHRCHPNACNILCEDGWAICVLKPIKAGEELFRNFFLNFKGGKPQGDDKFVAKFLNITCGCYECVNDLPPPPPQSQLFTLLKRISPVDLLLSEISTRELADFTPQNIKSFKALIERIKLNWAELNEYYTKNKRDLSIHQLSLTNTSTIFVLSSLRFMPCVSDKSRYSEVVRYT